MEENDERIVHKGEKKRELKNQHLLMIDRYDECHMHLKSLSMTKVVDF